MATLVITTDAPIVDGPPQGRWTHADWEKLPADGNRYEVIDGVLYMSTSPSFFHQWIVMRAYDELKAQVGDTGLAVICISPVGVFMPGCDPVQPDVVVVAIGDRGFIRDG